MSRFTEVTTSQEVGTNKRRLYPYQRDILEYCLSTKTPALFVEMRLGKSVVTLRRLSLLPGRITALIVMPSSAVYDWKREINAEGFRWLDITMGAADKRCALLESLEGRGEESAIVLWNREGWRSRMVAKAVQDVNWDMVILDESTFIKNPRSGVTKYFLNGFRHIPQRWIMTGTPNPEGEDEFYCQMSFVQPRYLGYRDYWDFRQAYMEPHPLVPGAWRMKPGMSAFLQREISKSAYVLRRKDVSLSEIKTYKVETVGLGREARRIYDQYETDFLAELEDGRIVKTIHKCAQYTFLRRLCGGIVIPDKDDPPRIVDTGKAELLCDLLGRMDRNEQVVVWVNYNDEIGIIQERLRKIKINSRKMTGTDHPDIRHNLLNDFQRGAFRVFVIQQVVGQMGVNLSAADTMIYYSTPVSALARQQTEARIVTMEKIKRGRPLLIVDLVVENSIDEDVLEAVRNKSSTSEKSLDLILTARMRRRVTSGKDIRGG